MRFTALPEHIDIYDHVNNAVWVRWMEEVATAHWDQIAPPEHREAYAWLVTRHEIDYRGNIREGEQCEAIAKRSVGDQVGRVSKPNRAGLSAFLQTPVEKWI